jgi:pyruvate formate lyase activating enzyme
MDIKSSIENYGTACGVWDVNTDNILKSIDIIKNCRLPYEFRTTLVKGIHTFEDMEDIAETIKGAKAYFLQSYEESGDIMISKQNEDNLSLSSFSEEELNKFLAIAKNKIPSASLRGIS